MITVKNLTRLPYLVDDDGRLLGGGEVGSADENSRHVTQGIEAKILAEVPEEVVVEVKESVPTKSKARTSVEES